MPIYEYHCNECGHEFEVMQKINDRPIRKCEKCGRLKAKRMISQTSFILKGSGWYVTDYSGKKPPANGNGNGNGNGKSAEANDNSSDKKSDSKTDKPAVSKDKTEKKSASA